MHFVSLCTSCLRSLCSTVRLNLYHAPSHSHTVKGSLLQFFSCPLISHQHHRDGARGGLPGHHTSGGGRRWVTALRGGTLDRHLCPRAQTALLHSPAQGDAGRRWEKGKTLERCMQSCQVGWSFQKSDNTYRQNDSYPANANPLESNFTPTWKSWHIKAKLSLTWCFLLLKWTRYSLNTRQGRTHS